jgi:hypothetical protein
MMSEDAQGGDEASGGAGSGDSAGGGAGQTPNGGGDWKKWTPWATGIGANAKELVSRVLAKSSSRILNATTKQLQAKFKHAANFGVTGNWNKAAAGRFNSAINQHINSAGVKTINGTYRGQSVIHHINPNTGLNVISSPSGQFISGWKLNPTQLQNVLKHGGL